MPDIREVLAALDENDKRLWSQHRTEMRKSYLNAHNAVLGVAAWDYNDDAFIDLIDIKLALLFDKAGRFNTVKSLTANDETVKTETEIIKQDDVIREALKIKPSIATQSMQPNGIGWPSSGFAK